MSSQPLYERIIVDRRDMKVNGFMFETKQDETYSEQFVYSKQTDGKVTYDMFLFKSPGLMKILRYRMFNWGISNMQTLIKAQE